MICLCAECGYRPVADGDHRQAGGPAMRCAECRARLDAERRWPVTIEYYVEWAALEPELDRRRRADNETILAMIEAATAPRPSRRRPGRRCRTPRCVEPPVSGLDYCFDHRLLDVAQATEERLIDRELLRKEHGWA